jgi:hypothetical protein
MDQVHSPAAVRRIIEAKPVVGGERETFLPQAFGPDWALAGKFSVYDWMARVCPAYRGDFWNYYRLSNGGFYMAPGVVGGAKLRVVVYTNAFDGDLSHDAAGILVTLLSVNHLAGIGPDRGPEHLYDAFDKLREFALDHAESSLIMSAAIG